mgnify:CR=1 FL=1
MFDELIAKKLDVVYAEFLKFADLRKEVKDEDIPIIIKKSNLKNVFLDGEIIGRIEFLPFFTFDLDANLNSINLNSLSFSFPYSKSCKSLYAFPVIPFTSVRKFFSSCDF